MTDSSENGGKIGSKDPMKIAVILLIVVAVIMLALLVKNCVSGATHTNGPYEENTETTNTPSPQSANETEIIN